MEKLVLNAEKRDLSLTAKEVRFNKRIPAVVYGKKIENTMISLDYSDYLRLSRKLEKDSTIELNLDGKTINVKVGEIQYAPVSGAFIHIDFVA